MLIMTENDTKLYITQVDGNMYNWEELLLQISLPQNNHSSLIITK